MEHYDGSFDRSILDAIPLPIFIVDGDVRIQAINPAAAAMLGAEESRVRTLRGGEALHCLHVKDSPDGCGRGPHCHTCVIRSSVMEVLGGATVSRRRMQAELVSGERTRRLDLLVTAKKLPASDGQALVILEDISEISTLHDIIPSARTARASATISATGRRWRAISTTTSEWILPRAMPGVHEKTVPGVLRGSRP